MGRDATLERACLNSQRLRRLRVILRKWSQVRESTRAESSARQISARQIQQPSRVRSLIDALKGCDEEQSGSWLILKVALS